MSDGDTHEKPPPRKRRWGLVPFLVLFLGGFAVFALKNFANLPEISLKAVFPLLGGAAMAGAVAWMVIRERRERRNTDDDGESSIPP